MKTLVIVLIWLSIMTSQNCSSIHQIKLYDGPEILKSTDFCELDKIDAGSFVSTMAYYTGVEEYWGLTSNTGCDLDHQVYLNTNHNYENKTNKCLTNQFNKLYRNYWKYSLKLRIVGKLERTNGDLGFGSLGLLNTQIIPYQIEILDKKKLQPSKSSNQVKSQDIRTNGVTDSNQIDLIRISINSLIERSLTKNSNRLTLTIFDDSTPIAFEEFRLKDAIISSLNNDKPDVILNILNSKNKETDIRFTSFDEGGVEHTGMIKLKRIDQKWIFEKINFISSIE